MFCSNCGAKIEDGEKFCSECGKPVERAEAAESDAVFADAQPAVSNTDEPESTEAAVEPDENPQEEVKEDAAVNVQDDYAADNSAENPAENEPDAPQSTGEYTQPYTAQQAEGSAGVSSGDRGALFYIKGVTKKLWKKYRSLNKTPRIVIAVIAAILFLLIVVKACSSGNNDNYSSTAETSAPVMYNLRVNVESEANVFFNTYDIEIYLDGTKIGNVSNGGEASYTVEAEEGMHLIYFYRNEEHSVSAAEDINITSDSTYSCHLTSRADEIEVTDVQFLNYISDTVTESAAVETEETTGIDYYAGFYGLTLADVAARAEELGVTSYTISSGISSKNLTDSFASMSAAEKSAWVVENASAGDTASEARIEVFYTGKKSVPDVENMTADKAEAELHKNEFSDITVKSDDGTIIIVESNWKVVSQSVSAGTKYGANKEIVLTCVKNNGSVSGAVAGAVADEIFGDTLSTTKSSTTKASTKATTKSSVSTGKQNALRSAKDYLAFSAFSKQGLEDQLEYEGYTADEIKYAVDNCGADWNEQAARCAKEYLELYSFSKQELEDQLEYEGFTDSQIAYGVKAAGY